VVVAGRVGVDVVRLALLEAEVEVVVGRLVMP
jgi:hypothetical protein